MYIYVIAAISIDSYASFNNFFSFITFSLLTDPVILVLNWLVFMLCLSVHLLSLISPAPLHNLHCLF